MDDIHDTEGVVEEFLGKIDRPMTHGEVRDTPEVSDAKNPIERVKAYLEGESV